MKNNNQKMPKWNEMVMYEKVLTILAAIIAVIYVGIGIYYKFRFEEVYNLMLAAVLLLNGGIYIRTKRNMAYVWFGLGILEVIFVIFSMILK